MAETEDLMIRFIGLDLLSTVASRVGNSIDRLGYRLERLSTNGTKAQQRLAVSMEQSAQRIAVAQQKMVFATEDGAKRIAAARNFTLMQHQLQADQEIAAQARIKNAYASLASFQIAADSQQGQQFIRRIEQQERLKAMQRATAVSSAQIAEEHTARLVQQSQAEAEHTLAVERGVHARIAARLQERREHDAHTEQLLSNINRVSQASALVGIGMLAGFGAGSAGLVAAATHAAEFQRQMLFVHTQTGGSKEEVRNMTKAVLDMAPAYGVTADEATKALYRIESLGIRGDAALDALRAGLQGAKIGGAGMETTVDALASIMASKWVPAGTKATEVMALLDATVGIGKMRMEDLNASLRSGIVGTATTYGASIKSVMAALATLTDQGMPAAIAGTRLRMTLSLLGAPSDKAAKQLKHIGLAATDLNIAIREHGLTGALQLLHDHITKAFGPNALGDLKSYNEELETNGEAAADAMAEKMGGAAALLTRAFGGGRSSAAIMTLVSNLDRVKNREAQLTQLTDSWGERWSSVQDSAAFKLDQFRSKWDVFVTKIGTLFLPVLLSVVDYIGKIIDKVGNWIEQNQQIVKSLAPAVTIFGVLFGLLLLVVGVLGIFGAALAGMVAGLSVIGGVLAPLALVLVAVGAAAYLMITHWKDVVKFWNTTLYPAIHQVELLFRGLFRALAEFWEVAGPNWKQTFDTIAEILFRHGGAWDFVKDRIHDAWQVIKDFVKSDAFATIVAVFAVSLPKAITTLVRALDTLVAGFRATFRFLGSLAQGASQIYAGHWQKGWDIITKGYSTFNSDMEDVARKGEGTIAAVHDEFSAKTEESYARLKRNIRGTMEHAFDDVGTATQGSLEAVSDKIEEHRLRGHAAAKHFGNDLMQGATDGIQERKVNAIEAARAAADAVLDASGQEYLNAKQRDEEAARSAGMDISASFNDGLGLAGSDYYNEGFNLSNAIEQGLYDGSAGIARDSYGEFWYIGQQITSGIADGVRDTSQSIADALGQANDYAFRSTLVYARIQSPSRLYAEKVGRPIGQGISVGIGEEQEAAALSMKMLIDRTQQVFVNQPPVTPMRSAPLLNAQPTDNQKKDITLKVMVPLSIDGREIGKVVKTIMPEEIAKALM